MLWAEAARHFVYVAIYCIFNFGSWETHTRTVFVPTHLEVEAFGGRGIYSELSLAVESYERVLKRWGTNERTAWENICAQCIVLFISGGVPVL